MYAKLVATVNLSGGSIPISSVMKDIGRVITATTATTSMLTAFSTSSSVIVDPTTAGWSYVGSNWAADQGSISAGQGPTMTAAGSTMTNYCFSAPCQNTGLLKYAILNYCNVNSYTENVNNGIVLTGAQSATSTGVVTNEGGRNYWSTGSYNGSIASILPCCFQPAAGSTFHVIANARHLTIIQENVGIMGIWETANTTAHTFLNIPPFIQYSHPNSNSFPSSGSGLYVVPTAQNTNVGVYLQTAVAFGTTNFVSPQVNGTVSVANITGYNTNTLLQYANNIRGNTIDSASTASQYIVSPVYFQDGQRGYPIQTITGTVPIYWTKPGLGNTGDTVSINGTTYTFFNCGAGYGVLMTTGN